MITPARLLGGVRHPALQQPVEALLELLEAGSLPSSPAALGALARVLVLQMTKLADDFAQLRERIHVRLRVQPVQPMFQRRHPLRDERSAAARRCRSTMARDVRSL